ncbi:hypothetical protein THASP1DRAFT_28716 [Thamnocephalis sphaerospora]|uniref:Uncharacterized protein n=1 Tax=Thamnocephalis sphaerospora TaxID=78915 RepID=A0A4P9XTK7_9FUNG|nr:hypothetical protein THASP1DRAFT_28716 [Thamnocephalis sphaerospora]|eukprot:RKP09493.1 hypothetical protein THASP1DRAFT_28716 [Thamnocephalis sphaerospora]
MDMSDSDHRTRHSAQLCALGTADAMRTPSPPAEQHVAQVTRSPSVHRSTADISGLRPAYACPMLSRSTAALPQATVSSMLLLRSSPASVPLPPSPSPPLSAKSASVLSPISPEYHSPPPDAPSPALLAAASSGPPPPLPSMALGQRRSCSAATITARPTTAQTEAMSSTMTAPVPPPRLHAHATTAATSEHVLALRPSQRSEPASERSQQLPPIIGAATSLAALDLSAPGRPRRTSLTDNEPLDASLVAHAAPSANKDSVSAAAHRLSSATQNRPPVAAAGRSPFSPPTSSPAAAAQTTLLNRTDHIDTVAPPPPMPLHPLSSPLTRTLTRPSPDQARLLQQHAEQWSTSGGGSSPYRNVYRGLDVYTTETPLMSRTATPQQPKFGATAATAAAAAEDHDGVASLATRTSLNAVTESEGPTDVHLAAGHAAHKRAVAAATYNGGRMHSLPIPISATRKSVHYRPRRTSPSEYYSAVPPPSTTNHPPSAPSWHASTVMASGSARPAAHLSITSESPWTPLDIKKRTASLPAVIKPVDFLTGAVYFVGRSGASFIAVPTLGCRNSTAASTIIRIVERWLGEEALVNRATLAAARLSSSRSPRRGGASPLPQMPSISPTLAPVVPSPQMLPSPMMPASPHLGATKDDLDTAPLTPGFGTPESLDASASRLFVEPKEQLEYELRAHIIDQALFHCSGLANVTVNLCVLPCNQLAASTNAAITMLSTEYEYACELQVRVMPSLSHTPCSKTSPHAGSAAPACACTVVIERR